MTQEELSASFYYLCQEAYKISIIEKMLTSIPTETTNIKEICLKMYLIVNLSLLPTFEKNNLQKLINTFRSIKPANFEFLTKIYQEFKIKTLKSELTEKIENLLLVMCQSKNMLSTNLVCWFERKKGQKENTFNVASTFYEFFTLPQNIINCEFDYDNILAALKATNNPNFMSDGFYR